MKVLLSGGSGFIGAHCVDSLLSSGHDVVFTVRSDEKGQKILNNHPKASKEQLSYVIVKDIAQEDAFEEAVKSEPPFEAVLHTASPFHYNVTDPKKDLLDPAVIGTTGILKSIKKNAPSVKRVVVTSSFAAITNPNKHEKVYSEANWNPMSWDEAQKTPANAYRGSKTFAEKAAWEFVEKEKPNFTLATINPPFVYGPVISYLESLSNVNTSNARILKLIQGEMKDETSSWDMHGWVDVRDVAVAHVKAMEAAEAGGKRFFCISGLTTTADVVNVIKKNYPTLKDKLPAVPKGDKPEDIYQFDNSQIKKILGVQFGTLDKSIIDTVQSLLDLGA